MVGRRSRRLFGGGGIVWRLLSRRRSPRRRPLCRLRGRRGMWVVLLGLVGEWGMPCLDRYLGLGRCGGAWLLCDLFDVQVSKNVFS